VVVPAEEVGIKERVKNDIVLVEAVPEFKPRVVKRDYEDEGRLREEREREFLEREKQLQERERNLKRREAQQNKNGTWVDERIKRNQRTREEQMNRGIRRTGSCAFGSPANPDGSCDIGPLRKPNRNKPKGNFNFNIRIGK
jgi:hypothetical protein